MESMAKLNNLTVTAFVLTPNLCWYQDLTIKDKSWVYVLFVCPLGEFNSLTQISNKLLIGRLEKL